MTRSIFIIASLLLGGCSSQVFITIDSDPPGAEVYEGQKSWGRSPITLAYNPSEEFARGGCMGTNPIKVQWDSGAEARVNTLNLCAKSTAGKQFTFEYPQIDPGARNENRRVESSGKLLYRASGEKQEEVLCSSDVSDNHVVTTCS